MTDNPPPLPDSRHVPAERVSKARTDSHAVLFLATFFALYAMISVGTALAIARIGYLQSLLFFVTLQVINLGVAYGLAELILGLLLPAYDLPQLQALCASPSVAVLCTTYNDIIPECMSSLTSQTYDHYTVFILDDSSDAQCRSLVDALAEANGFRVQRRAERSGFKAGALNEWLANSAQDFDYIVVVDADSVLGETFIESMLGYAEHPDNRDVALFQSKIDYWNTDRVLPRVASYMLPATFHVMDRLINSCGYLPSWGHNNMYRVSALLASGGFDERFTSEDLATGLNMVRAGFRCRMVQVVTSEAFPTTFSSYAGRSSRWARQTLQLVLHRRDSGGVPISTQMHILMAGYGYGIQVLFVLGMIAVAWAGHSSLADLRFVITRLGDATMIGYLFLIAAHVSYLFLRNVPLAVKYRTGVWRYLVNLLMYLTLGCCSILPIAKGVVSALVSRKRRFPVTDKRQAPGNWRSELRKQLPLMVLIAVVLAGLARNPVALLFNWHWILPFVASPVVVSVMTRMEGRGVSRDP